jgi:poly(A) polymerase
MPPLTERAFAVDVVRRLRTAGHEALFAGGCVRDELLKLTPKDYDVATSAHPDMVRALFSHTVAVGESFGVIDVLGPRTDSGRLIVQVATFRTDLYDVNEADGRHPDAVAYSTPQEDAQRRDFTINGMFLDPLENRLHDYVGGEADLRNRVLRAIGEPRVRFTEDKLRLLRGVRMAARFGLTIEPQTAAAIRAMAEEIHVVSAERIADELRKMLVERYRTVGMQLFVELGLAKPVMPELLPMKGLPQGLPSAPTGDLWEHVLRVLDLLGDRVSFPLALGALLHDVGKPRTVGRIGDRYTFYAHEHVGKEMALAICERLRLSNDETQRVSWLVEKHQILADARQMRTSKLKMLLNHPGIRELLDLHRADALASKHSLDHVEYCEHLLREWGGDVLNPEPIMTGHDLMKMGLEQGPIYRKLLDAVREAQLDETIKTFREARELVVKLLAEWVALAPPPAWMQPREREHVVQLLKGWGIVR